MPSIVAWDQLCKRARARRIRDLLQRPSFRPSEDHTANLRQFVDAHGEDGFHLAWEPRGVWLGAPDLVAELSEELDLIAVVDRFRKAPAAGDDPLYAIARAKRGPLRLRVRLLGGGAR